MPLMPMVMLLIILAPLAALGWLAYWGYANQRLWVMALIPGLAEATAGVESTGSAYRYARA